MTVPDYQSLMSPILIIASDRKEHSVGEMTEQLARYLKITEEERLEGFQAGDSQSSTIE